VANLSRKELLKEEDAFLAAAQQGAHWAGSHRKYVWAGMALLCVVVGTVWGGSYYVERQRTQASEAFNKGMDVLAAEVITETADTKAQPQGTPPTYASEQDKWKKASEHFQKAASVAGFKDVGVLAQLHVADMADRLGDQGKAEAALTTMIKNLSKKDPMYFLAADRLAYVLESKGSFEAAVASLDPVVNQGGFYADYALLHQAHIWVSKGDYAKAKSALKKLETSYTESSVLDTAKALTAQVGFLEKGGVVSMGAGQP
jgi:predicted negative regulator of RcsB-dependent stress response